MEPEDRKAKLLGVLALLIFIVCATFAGLRNSQQNSTYKPTIADPEQEREYQTFVKRYQKQYPEEEYYLRLQMYLENAAYIRMFNSLSPSLKLAVNALADLTPKEYSQMLSPASEESEHGDPTFLSTENLPDTINWVEAGAVTKVRDQKYCGACYAFAAAGAAEAAVYSKTKDLESLSEQELVDCSKSYGNHGCRGGHITYSFSYMKAKGLVRDTDYPYDKYDHECLATTDSDLKTFISGYKSVPRRNQQQLKAAVALQPVAAAVEADQLQFQFYSSGVLDTDCGSSLTHAVLLVGYGVTDDDIPYWLAKNSWGTDWGEHGYFRLRRNDLGTDAGTCGLTLDASYPLV